MRITPPIAATLAVRRSLPAKERPNTAVSTFRNDGKPNRLPCARSKGESHKQNPSSEIDAAPKGTTLFDRLAYPVVAPRESPREANMAGEELILATVLAVIFVLAFLASAIKVVREYERLVVFRLGRLTPKPKGPGLTLIVPIINKRVLIDLRTVAFEVPRQHIVTRDNVSVEVDAVLYYRVYAPNNAVTEVQNYNQATDLLAQTTLRDVLGQVEFDALLSRRAELSQRIQVLLDANTEPWGIKVSAVTLRDVSLPETMVRAIAKQAEAERERRSRVIMAEGEAQAAVQMKKAADLYESAASAMRLRELETLTEIAREKNMIVVRMTEK